MDNRCQSNILLCGSPRVGKSTLINAICHQNLAKSNASLNSVTKEIERYSCKYMNGQISHETVIWDTPGIESWNQNDVYSYIRSLIEQTRPLCMIYCASPGSFARLDCLTWLIQECHRQKIFCAFVCTNMWSASNRKLVVEEFCRILSRVHPTIKPIEEDNIIYYDKLALVTMVNSQEFYDEDFGVRKPASGVEELIFGIAKSLDRELMFIWFRSVAQNKSFWTKMASKLSDLLKMPIEKFTSFCAHAANFLDSFIPSSYDNPSDQITSIPRQTTSITKNENLFDDAVIVCIPEHIYSKTLTITLQSTDMKIILQLQEILKTLGATNCRTQELLGENKQSYVITSEFDSNETAKAIYDLWELIIATKFGCTISNKQTTNNEINTF